MLTDEQQEHMKKINEEIEARPNRRKRKAAAEGAEGAEDGAADDQGAR